MPLDEALVVRILEQLIPFVTERGIGEISGILFELFPYEKICQIANSATAYAARGDYYHAASIFTWEDPSMDEEIWEFNRKLIKLLKVEGFKGKVTQYNNYEGEF
jgi:hypothetical protein